MKIWLDDVRPAPEGYVWCKSVNLAHHIISTFEIIKEAQKEDCFLFPNLDLSKDEIELIDIDHDAGDYAKDGGDYIRLLDWLEETGRSYPIRIHSANVVGVANMRRIIERNGWKEVR